MLTRRVLKTSFVKFLKVNFVLVILVLSSILFVSNAIAPESEPKKIKYREGIHLNFNIRDSGDLDYPYFAEAPNIKYYFSEDCEKGIKIVSGKMSLYI
jgi:hypothetical protein